MHIFQLSLVTGGRLDAQGSINDIICLIWIDAIITKRLLKKYSFCCYCKRSFYFGLTCRRLLHKGEIVFVAKWFIHRWLSRPRGTPSLERFENSEIFFWKSNNLIFRFGPNSESFLFFSPFLGADLKKDLVASESQTRVLLATSNAQTIWLKQRNTAITLSPKVN